MSSSSANAAFNPAVGAPPTRLLVVEDDLVTQAMLADQLAAGGYVVDRATSAEEALALLDAHEYDVAFVDMVLPGATGLDLLSTLRDRAPHTEAIIMTAHPAVHHAITCLQAGAVDYLAKPLNFSGLVPLVHKAIERQRHAARLVTLEACQSIFAISDTAEIPKEIVAAAMRVANADDASLMLTDSDGGLRLAYSHSLGRTEHCNAKIALGDRIAGKVAASRQPMVINSDLSDDPRLAGITPATRRIRSSIICPLMTGDRLLGVLNINRIKTQAPFKTADLEEVKVLAAQASSSLDSARLVRELNQRVDELSRAQSCILQSERLAAIGQLAAGVAHEINNPVAYVMANVEFVLGQLGTLKTVDPAAEAAAAKEILWRWWQQVGARVGFDDLNQALLEAREGAGRIREIVADMRTLARSDRGQEELFDLNLAVRSAIRLATSEIRGSAELKADLGPNVMVHGNVGQLSQVFLNLLVNAAQAIPIGQGATAKITVTTRLEGDAVVVSIADTGVGITVDAQAHIFEPFFTTKPAGKGMGLGLSISRETVQRHKGDMAFWSQPGVGTTFTITLPSAAGPTKEADTGRRAPGRADAPLRERRARLLFVDDEESLRNSYQRYFGGRYDVIVAQDGRRAMELLARNQDVDLIVCDLVMPGMSGMELFRLASAKYPALEGRFIFVTGGVGRAEVQSFLATVKNPTFEKPFKYEQIDELLHPDLPATIG
jgi:two-component system, NtrC family, sensor kinase